MEHVISFVHILFWNGSPKNLSAASLKHFNKLSHQDEQTFGTKCHRFDVTNTLRDD